MTDFYAIYNGQVGVAKNDRRMCRTMTNAERAEIKMWVRRLESAERCLKTFNAPALDDMNKLRLHDAVTQLNLAITNLESIR